MTRCCNYILHVGCFRTVYAPKWGTPTNQNTSKPWRVCFDWSEFFVLCNSLGNSSFCIHVVPATMDQTEINDVKEALESKNANLDNINE